MASFLPVEVKFAQNLADNEKKIRFRAVKKLKKYLRARSTSGKDGFTKDDFLKIWKGLHYCLWMQDKPLIQEELSVTLTQMVHELTSVEAKMLFIKVFFITEAREWSAIDVWRIDKFMMLVRNMLHESLIAVRKLHWKPEVLDMVVMIYSDMVMNPTSDVIPDGLKIHFTDIYLEEVEQVGGEQLTAKQLTRLLDPFVSYLKFGKNPPVHRRIMSRVFEAILARGAVMVKQKTSAGTDEPQDSAVPFMSMQFDNSMIADHLFQQSQCQGVHNKNRTALYDLVKRLRDVEQGALPQQKEVLITPGVSHLDMKKAVTSLVTMETQNTKDKSKKKKKNKANEKNENTDPNNNAPADTEETNPIIETAPPASSKKGKRKHAQEDLPEAPLTKIKKKNTEGDTDGTGLRILRGVLKNKLKKDKAKKITLVKRDSIEETAPLPSSAVVRETRASVAKVTPKKLKKDDKKSEKVLQHSTHKETDAKVAKETPKKSKKGGKEAESVSQKSDQKETDASTEVPKSFKVTEAAENVSWTPNKQTEPIKFRDSVINKAPGSGKKRKAPEPVEKIHKDNHPSENTNVVPQIVIETHSLSPKSRKSHSPSPKSNKSPGSDFAKFDGSKPPVAFVRRSLVKVNIGLTPESRPGSAKAQQGSAKRVSFDMKKNMAQGFTESLNSPMTPYNPTKKPEQGILKSPVPATTPVTSLSEDKITPPTPRSQNAIERVKAKRRGTPQIQTPVTAISRPTPPQVRTPVTSIARPTHVKKKEKPMEFFFL